MNINLMFVKALTIFKNLFNKMDAVQFKLNLSGLAILFIRDIVNMIIRLTPILIILIMITTF